MAMEMDGPDRINVSHLPGKPSNTANEWHLKDRNRNFASPLWERFRVFLVVCGIVVSCQAKV